MKLLLLLALPALASAQLVSGPGYTQGYPVLAPGTSIGFTAFDTSKNNGWGYGTDTITTVKNNAAVAVSFRPTQGGLLNALVAYLEFYDSLLRGGLTISLNKRRPDVYQFPPEEGFIPPLVAVAPNPADTIATWSLTNLPNSTYGTNTNNPPIIFTPAAPITIEANQDYWFIYASSNPVTTSAGAPFSYADSPQNPTFNLAKLEGSMTKWSLFDGSTNAWIEPFNDFGIPIAVILGSPIPEPSTYAALMGATTLLAVVILRRRKTS